MFITIPVSVTGGISGENLAELLKVLFERIRLPYYEYGFFKNVVIPRPHTVTLAAGETRERAEPRAELSLSESLVKTASLLTRPGGSSVSAVGPRPDPRVQGGPRPRCRWPWLCR